MISLGNRESACEFLTGNQLRQRIIENTEDAVVVTDSNAVVEMINPGFTRLFGYTEDEALGRRVNELIILEHTEAGLRKSGRFTFDEKNKRKKIIRSFKNGRAFDVLTRITPIMMNNQEIGSFAFYREVR